MVKRCIGIDIGSSCLRAVQVSRTGEHFNIEKVFSIQTRRDSDSPPEILRSLTSKYGFDRRADVAVSMPNDAVFYRNLETDVTGLEQICGLSKGDPKREKEHLQTQSVLEHNFPIEPEEIVAQVCSYRQPSGDKYSVLVAAVKRASLHERMNILAEAKIHPNLVEAAIFAVHSAVAVNHPEIMTGQAIIAYIDESYLTLAVLENNSILLVRNIPIVSCSDNSVDFAQEQIAEVLSRELEITWQKVFGGAIQEDTKIYLVSKGNVSKDLEATIAESLPCQTTVVDSYEKVECSAQGDGDTEISLAKGLALRVLAPDRTAGINFRQADTANVKPTLDRKKELITCAILMAAIAVVSLLGLFVRLSYLERKYAHIKNEISQVFQAALPEEKNIVSPLSQLEQELQSLRKDYRLFAPLAPTDSRPLDVLRSITLNTPSQGNVKIDDLLITTESVRLNGTCDSFESVYQWQRLLQKIPGFALVDVQDVQKEPKSGAVHFTIVVSSVIPEQK
jgi:Tfp pilus assembly PilM family ATPase/Tfp pilus assembly protein PilN